MADTRALSGAHSWSASRLVVQEAPRVFCLGVAYVTLIGGLDAGRVALFAPLSGTHASRAVALSGVLIPRAETGGRRWVLAAGPTAVWPFR